MLRYYIFFYDFWYDVLVDGLLIKHLVWSGFFINKYDIVISLIEFKNEGKLSKIFKNTDIINFHIQIIPNSPITSK